MAHFLPPEHVRQVNKLEWPNALKNILNKISYMKIDINPCESILYFFPPQMFDAKLERGLLAEIQYQVVLI